MERQTKRHQVSRRRRLWLWSEWSEWSLASPPLILAEHAYPREDGSHPAGATSWSGAGGGGGGLGGGEGSLDAVVVMVVESR